MRAPSSLNPRRRLGLGLEGLTGLAAHPAPVPLNAVRRDALLHVRYAVARPVARDRRAPLVGGDLLTGTLKGLSGLQGLHFELLKLYLGLDLLALPVGARLTGRALPLA
jgi:hypothetical protein